MTLQTRGDWLQELNSIANPHDRDDALQASGFGDDEVEAASCDVIDGRSTKISGCHEASETRTIRVKNTFSNDTSPQPHRGWPPS